MTEQLTLPIYTAEEEAHIDSARTRIEKILETHGEFTHNRLSAVLQGLAHNVSTTAADEMIDEFLIDKTYGIKKVNCPGLPKGWAPNGV